MAFVYATFAIQQELAGAGAGWTALGTDIAHDPITVKYGIEGSTPNDRVANAGKMTWSLRNSILNSGGALGYYSLLNASKRSGFALNNGVRLAISCPDVAGGTLYYKFRGTLSETYPTPGAYADRLVKCVAVDWWDDAANNDEPDIATQTNKRPDQLLTTLLAALTTQPPAQTLETGSETYAFAFDGGVGGTGRRLKVRERINQIVKSEVGYAYSKGDTTQGGTLYFENRHHRASNPTVLFTFTNDPARDGLTVPATRSDVWRKVLVAVHPTNNVATAATIVLWSLQKATLLLQPGETNSTVFGAFFDPTTKEHIGANSTSAVTATTDYLMNSAADGSGSNLTANLTATASATGLGVAWTLTNTGATAGYVTLLQIRGIPIYRYDAQIQLTVTGSYGDQVLDYDMPLQNDVNVATSVGQFFTSILAVLYARVKSVKFLANKSAAYMAAALQLEPGDRIAITETVTGLAHQFTINSVGLQGERGGILWCTWGLEPATLQAFWLWGVAGASEWGVTTNYGF